MNRIFRAIWSWAVRSPFNVLLIAGGSLLMLSFAVIAQNERTATADYESTAQEWSLIARPITNKDHTMGDVGAPIQLIVYADFQCRYCGSLFNVTVPRLQKAFGDKIVFAFRHLPLAEQPQAKPEAEASECVALLGGEEAFWNFAHIMYAIPNFYKGIDLSTLPDIATRAGVDRERFIECYAEGKGEERVARDRLEGSIAGINITPSTVLKSAHRAVIVNGDYYSQLFAAVSYLLETNAQIEARQ